MLSCMRIRYLTVICSSPNGSVIPNFGFMSKQEPPVLTKKIFYSAEISE